MHKWRVHGFNTRPNKLAVEVYNQPEDGEMTALGHIELPEFIKDRIAMLDLLATADNGSTARSNIGSNLRSVDSYWIYNVPENLLHESSTTTPCKTAEER